MWRTNLAFANEVNEHIASIGRCILACASVDIGQIVRVPTRGPGLRPRRPAVECGGTIPGRDRVIAALQARIDETGRGDIGDGRIVIAIGINDRDPSVAASPHGIRTGKAVVA